MLILIMYQNHKSSPVAVYDNVDLDLRFGPQLAC